MRARRLRKTQLGTETVSGQTKSGRKGKKPHQNEKVAREGEGGGGKGATETAPGGRKRADESGNK